MNREVPSGSRPQRYTQILLIDNENPQGPVTLHPALEKLAGINPDEITPLQALATIAELRNVLNRKGNKP
jgi:DNA mismatch repair protein MutS